MKDKTKDPRFGSLKKLITKKRINIGKFNKIQKEVRAGSKQNLHLLDYYSKIITETDKLIKNLTNELREEGKLR